MRVINKARGKIEKIWGKQTLKDTQYRLLKYVLQTEYEDGLLLHNVVSGELIQLNKEEKELLEMFPSKADSNCSELIEKHFLVPVDYNEKKTVGQLRTLLRAMQKKDAITGYTILPTSYCNARCFYCYECDYEHIHMSEETAKRAVDYIHKHSKGKKISIGWFGGEPLVGEKIISLISKELKEKDVEFSSSMISNGFLFNEELVKKAAEDWKLKNVQITIDGTEDVYNKVKDYINPKGSPYKRVLNNIRLLSEAGIRVSIRINLGFHNEDDTQNLIEELSEYFKECKNVSMYVHELFENEGTNPRSYSEEEKNHLTKKVIELNDYIAEKGKYSQGKSLPSLRTNHCMADSNVSVIIQPDGGLSKCEHYTVKDEFGSIYSKECNQEKLKEWKVYTELEKCGECPLYPSCVMLKGCPDTGDCNVAKQKKGMEDAVKNMVCFAEKKGQTEEAEDSFSEDTDDIGSNDKNC